MLPFITFWTGRQKNGLPTWVNKENTNLACTSLAGYKLAGLNFSRSDMFKTNLNRADLEGANLSFAYMRKTNLKGANLTKANLKGTNLREADLSGAKVDGAEFKFAIFNGATVLPFTREEAFARGMV
ncbi:MAG: pentapeptide repeat-containing protein, partial [Proteobacteria bacterium]